MSNIRRLKFWNEPLLEDFCAQLLGMPLGTAIEVSSRDTAASHKELSAGLLNFKAASQGTGSAETGQSVRRTLDPQMGLTAVLDALEGHANQPPMKAQHLRSGQVVWLDGAFRRSKWNQLESLSQDVDQWQRIMTVLGHPPDKNFGAISEMVTSDDKSVVLVHVSEGRPGITWLAQVAPHDLRVQRPSHLDGDYEVVGIVERVDHNPVTLPRFLSMQGMVKFDVPPETPGIEQVPGPVAEIEILAGFRTIRL